MVKYLFLGFLIVVVVYCETNNAEEIENPEWKRVEYSYKSRCNTCHSTRLERTFKDGRIEIKYVDSGSMCTLMACIDSPESIPIHTYKNREELEKYDEL